MLRRYRLTPQAQEDLKNIRRYTRQHWGEQQAKDYLAQLRNALQSLLNNPNLGRHRADDLREGIYSYLHASHMIYYQHSENELIVVAVLHTKMVPSAHLEERL